MKRKTIKLDSIESNWPMAQLISSGAVELERRGRWPLRYYVLVVRDPSPFENVMTVWEGTEPTPRFRVREGWTEGDDAGAEVPGWNKGIRMGPDIDLDTEPPERIQQLRQYLVEHYGDLIVLGPRDHAATTTYVPRGQNAGAERLLRPLLDRADPDALREIREHGHPEVHAEGLITERFYEGGRAILKADPGKFRVVGVDTFASEDWVYAQYDDKQTAIECGTGHAHEEDGTTPKKMLKVYVYDDEGRIVYEGGSL